MPRSFAIARARGVARTRSGSGRKNGRAEVRSGSTGAVKTGGVAGAGAAAAGGVTAAGRAAAAGAGASGWAGAEGTGAAVPRSARNFVRSSSVSRSSRTTAMGMPTETVSPAGTRIFASVPDMYASNSMSALSVSISTSTSPFWMRSPSVLRQTLMVPSSIVSESFGILISRGMESLPASPRS
jgi:hypothetical protein